VRNPAKSSTFEEGVADEKNRYTDGQIAFALRQAETGTPVAEVVCKMGVSEQTFYRRKKQDAVMGVGEIRRLKRWKKQNRKLKQLVADLSLDKLMLQDVLSKKTLRPGRRRELVRHPEVIVCHGRSDVVELLLPLVPRIEPQPAGCRVPRASAASSGLQAAGGWG